MKQDKDPSGLRLPTLSGGDERMYTAWEFAGIPAKHPQLSLPVLEKAYGEP
jgi:hypothetical protein